jgi:hypothetical protein
MKSNDRPKRETMSIEEATSQHVRGRLHCRVALKAILRVLPSGLSHAPSAILLTERTFTGSFARGVIMTDLRALVGACFLLAVMGTVVSVPFGWAISSVLARPTQRSSRADHTSER